MMDTTVKMIEVFCTNTQSKFLVPSGTMLKDVIAYAGMENAEKILGATVNNKVQRLDYRIYTPRTVNFLDIFNANGKRMYALSLMFLCYKAVKDVYPDADLHIKHSMNDGYYTELINCNDQLTEATEKIKKQMQQLVEKNLPFERKIIPSNEAAELFDKVGMKEKAQLILSSGWLYTNVDILDGTVNAFFFHLVMSTGYLKIFDLVPYQSGMMLFMPDNDKDYSEPGVITKQDKLFGIFKEHQNWIEILQVPYVSRLNYGIKNGYVNQIIQVSEALHEKKYAEIADSIIKKKDNVKIVFLAGPSSSGKTTSCRRLATQLAVGGIHPVQISMDDYFNDREHTPKDENGEYDFECLEAVDLEFFSYQMQQLLKGEEVELPKFDFVKGEKSPSGNKIRLNDNSILIVEGIHALNPKLSADIKRKNKYFVFVSALTQVALDRYNLISTSDNRLIRRIVRDNNYRGSSAEDTLLRWASVRSGEEKHIFPYQENADSIFNSSLLYEIGLLKTYCEPLLMKVPQNSLAY
ncbi:MAG: nucleoside kinase, partial [Bacteroidales bacterium]|nr:nucleoside kinase [Bacteroidales bacterium]